MRLLIVESPNKVKKLQGYLDELYGTGSWEVAATVGHFRGLPAMKGQSFADVVDCATWSERFEMLKPDVASRLRTAIARASSIFLASDPDREGEAIAWHVVESFQPASARRVLFTEITKQALKAAIDNAGALDKALVDAQRSRQVLDYEIGMEVSRRLWRFGAKSAGRVQSAALRILVDRELVIRDFKAANFWTLHARYAQGFDAAVAFFEAPSPDDLDASGADPEPRLVPKRFATADEAGALVDDAKRRAHVVEAVDEKSFVRRPRPPFTTATLQAECATAFAWDAQKTQKLAQSLFEDGLVTYIRTDSTALSEEAIAEIREYLARRHPALLPPSPQRYADKAGAQGAHEAIRPVHVENDAAKALAGDERRLYDLILDRTLQSQAKNASCVRTTITVAPEGADYRLVAAGVVVVDKGFLALGAPVDASDDTLPRVNRGQSLGIKQLQAKASKTKPPPRFTQASLIRYLERKGIGRPSTYANIIATLLERDYVKKQKSFLVPDELGFLCDRLLRESFDALTQEGFTAKTESALDKIAAARLERPAFLARFHQNLTALLNGADVRLDAYAKRHPELDRNSTVADDKPCTKCGSTRIRRRGRFGAYAQCDNPECAARENLEPLKERKEPCPECEGTVVEQPFIKDKRKSKFFRCTSCAWKSSSPPPKVTTWKCHDDPAHGFLVEVVYEKDKKKRSFFLCRTCNKKFWTGEKSPLCPLCGASMRLRESRDGQFWGCSTYPTCRGTAPSSPTAPRPPSSAARRKGRRKEQVA